MAIKQSIQKTIDGSAVPCQRCLEGLTDAEQTELARLLRKLALTFVE